MTGIPLSLAVLGLLLALGSLAFTSAVAPVLRAWGVAAVATGGLFIAVWAISTDHDNLEYGLRLGRLVIPAVVALLALSWAVVRTARYLRGRLPN